MYRYLYSKLVYPLYHGLIGSGAVAATRDLGTHDIYTKDQICELEGRKLRELLTYAHSNVPFYRSAINESGMNTRDLVDTANIRLLPVLTKAIIRDQGVRLHSEKMDGNRLDSNSTSGSTGSPMRFFTDRRSKTYRKAVVTRNRQWLGIHTGDPVVRLWGSAIDQDVAETVRGRFHAMITRETFLSAYKIGDADFLKYAGVLRRRGARLLIGYPSVLSEFARFCGDRGIRFPRLHAIISSAEALYSHHRKTIEENLDTRVFNRYGCREVGDIAQEVPGQDGLLVNSDRVLVEIINDRGEPCSPGEMGRILVTDLDNFGMPLIRYDIGDFGCWASEDQFVGPLPYPVLQSIEGRSLDIVSSPSGARVGGTFWTILLRERPGIARFQVVQENIGGVQVRFVKDTNVSNVDIDHFRKKIADVLGAGFSVAFDEVDEIHPEPNGKFRLVVSRLDEQLPESARTGGLPR